MLTAAPRRVPTVTEVAPAAALAVPGQYEFTMPASVPPAPSLPGCVPQTTACTRT